MSRIQKNFSLPYTGFPVRTLPAKETCELPFSHAGPVRNKFEPLKGGISSFETITAELYLEKSISGALKAANRSDLMEMYRGRIVIGDDAAGSNVYTWIRELLLPAGAVAAVRTRPISLRFSKCDTKFLLNLCAGNR
jgi:hypothetical protein